MTLRTEQEICNAISEIERQAALGRTVAARQQCFIIQFVLEWVLGADIVDDDAVYEELLKTCSQEEIDEMSLPSTNCLADLLANPPRQACRS